ncbi:MAG: hypothetical protein V4738_14395 [Pseudomonadota bacterium]
MTKPIAQLDWSLRVDCPKCGEENDLAKGEHDPEYRIAGHVFQDRWEKLNDWKVTCQHCGHKFTIEKVEY